MRGGLIARVEQLLTDRFRGAVRLASGETLGERRSKVVRFAVSEGPDGAPSSVVVKHVHRDRARSKMDLVFPPDWLALNDWAGLSFLEDACGGDRIAPRLYAGDPQAGLLIMEDLGRVDQLDHYLMGSDPGVAEQALIGYSRAVGRMHALSHGRHEDFGRLRESLGPTPGSVEEYCSFAWLTDQLEETLESLDLVAGGEAEHDLRQVVEALREPGPFSVYTHGDCCPDNCLFVDSEAHLIDFEGGMYDHALLEGVYSRIPFPSCWCVARLPEEISRRMESVYRSELTRGCPVAGDDTKYFRAVVECCVYWALAFFWHVPLRDLLAEDRSIGVSSGRQIGASRLELVWKLSEQYGHCEALGALLGKAAGKLRQLWPAESCELATYPAFASGLGAASEDEAMCPSREA